VKIGLLAVVLIGAFVVGCKPGMPDDDWVAVTPADHSFAISMPGKPALTNENGAHEYMYVNKPVAVYALTYVDDVPTNGADPNQIVADTAARAVASVGGQVSRNVKVTVNGFPGLDVDLLASDGSRVFGRFCIVNHRLYDLRAVFDKRSRKAGVSERAQRFFNSFKPVSSP
jgi:hypothetical protein